MCDTLKMPEARPYAVDFFVVFSRFEFALKEAGFVRGKQGERAWPDWDAFSADKKICDLFPTLRNDPAIKDLIEEPPMCQIADGNGDWIWQKGKTVQDVPSLVSAIKQVRNNLFHGAKSGDDPRDKLLCSGARCALVRMLKAHNSVREMFEGKY